MKKFLPLCLFLFAVLCCCVPAWCQAGLEASYTTAESRCRATGAITIEVSGGSGNYNYKATGPVSTPFTSSKTITGLEAGSYTVTIKDVIQNKELQLTGVVVAGSYSDPRYVLNATDVSCAGNDGTIAVSEQQFGRAPFNYTIVAPSPAAVGVSSATGFFSGLPAGEYSIRQTDSCGGIQVRTVRIEAYNWWFETASLSRTTCEEATAAITLKNNKGATNLSGSAFTGFQYGVVQGTGDTLWNSNHSFDFLLGKRRTVLLVSKDPCGRVVAQSVSIANADKPAMNTSVNISDRACSTFTAAAAGQINLTSPQYCVYDNSNVEVACNTTGLFHNLPYGSYTMLVRDLCYDTVITRSFSQTAAVPAVGATVATSNLTCATFTASITGQTNLTNPQYCIYTNTNTLVACNTTGVFDNLPYGSYNITITDECSGMVINRSVTAARPVPAINSVSFSNQVCSGFEVRPNSTSNLQTNPQYCLYDNNGNLIACNSTGVFSNIGYGSYCMRAVTSCGDMSAPYCFSRSAPAPSVNANVSISNRTCTTYTASITGQSNLTNPQYCIYNSSNEQLACNSTGVFNNLPYGSYTIIITDGCAGATLTRTVSASQAVPSMSATVGVSNKTCTTFSATITGNNLTSPVYSVYDAADNLVASGSSNVFHNLPYGAYCFTVKDACTNTVLRQCQTIANPMQISITAIKTCTVNTTDLTVQFQGSGSPYKVTVVHPDGSVVREVSSASTTVNLSGVPALPAGAAYRVVGTNTCGQQDEKTIVPEATVIQKTAVVQSKCPSAKSQYGAGDLSITCSSNSGNVTPSITAKDGVAVNISHTSQNGNNFLFAALEPGTYRVQYSLQGCTSKVEETVTVAPYTYPRQHRSAIYQCDNNGFSMNASVAGGVGPFQYEIIGSAPESPAIVTEPQSSGIFDINNGTVYSLVRLRSTDACGNATLNDLSVLPLQHIAISASQTCLYQDVVFTVDTIPNATYQWFLQQSPGDSSLISTDAGLTVPFLVPEKTGTYICRVSVNNDCLTQVSYFELSGKCDDELLPGSVQLAAARAATGAVALQWQAKDETQVSRYIVERKGAGGASFKQVGALPVNRSRGAGAYRFTDTEKTEGAVQYRLRVMGVQGVLGYSNVVQVAPAPHAYQAQPNPAREYINIHWTTPRAGNWQLELYSAAGQLVHRNQVRLPQTNSYRFNRPAGLPPGFYLLYWISRDTGQRQLFKVIFE